MKLPTIKIRQEVLSAWLQVAGSTKSQLAVELGVSKGRVSQLFNSDVELSAHLIAKLILVTQIPFERLFKITSSNGSENGLRGNGLRAATGSSIG